MILFDLIAGLLLLLAGRPLFWICVGVVGFLIGVQCSAALGYTGPWTTLLMALALGSLGALLAIAFEWFMIVFGVGFLGGGYLLMNLFPSAPAGQEPYAWLIFVVGGIIGTCLMIIVFDWTLIIISSLLGATLIMNAFHGTVAFRNLVFLGIMVIGITVQYIFFRVQPPQEKSARP